MPGLAHAEVWHPVALNTLRRRGRPDQVTGYPEPGSYKPSAAVRGSLVGIPTGTVLTVVTGDVVLQAGQTYDSIDFTNAYVTYKGTGLAYARRCRFRSKQLTGTETTNKQAIYATPAVGGRLLLEDCELVGQYPSVRSDGLKGYRITARRCEIHTFTDTALFFGDDWLLEASWLHDAQHYAVDPNQSNGPSHDDGVQVQGGNNGQIIGSNVEGGANSGIQVTQDFSITSNLKIRKSWLGLNPLTVGVNGAVIMNVADKGKGSIVGLEVTDTVFRRDGTHKAALVQNTTSARGDFVWARNTWDDDGSPANYSSGGAGS